MKNRQEFESVGLRVNFSITKLNGLSLMCQKVGIFSLNENGAGFAEAPGKQNSLGGRLGTARAGMWRWGSAERASHSPKVNFPHQR